MRHHRTIRQILARSKTRECGIAIRFETAFLRFVLENLTFNQANWHRPIGLCLRENRVKAFGANSHDFINCAATEFPVIDILAHHKNFNHAPLHICHNDTVSVIDIGAAGRVRRVRRRTREGADPYPWRLWTEDAREDDTTETTRVRVWA